MLDTEGYQRAKAIFFTACEQPRDRQGDFVRAACGGDAALCSAVMDLLDQDANPLALVGAGGMRERLEQIAESSAGAATTESTLGAAAAPPDRIGRYRILRLLGEGGMGMVYLAEQESPRRQVALKVIAPGRSTRQSMRRFEHEAQALGRLQHPGIAHIHEAGMHDFGRGGQPYFAMELVRGRSLMDYCHATSADRRRRLELFAMICSAVEHAHQQGVVHRDLKPANILVDESSAPPQPKVLDFGVARIIDSDVQATTMHTAADQLMGTLAYMSPEQMSGRPEDIDTRSDVYALGVVLFELLTGRLPHDVSGKSVPEAIRTVSESEPAALSSVNRGLRGDLDVIVGRALERDKSRRYQSAGELAADVRRHLRDEPILARPASTVYQFRKFARRNQALVGGVAAVFFVLVAGMIVTAWQARRAIAARDREVDLRRLSDANAARALAVNNVLHNMLASANPEISGGEDVTVAHVLSTAASEIEAGSLRDHPDVEASVRLTLGEAYLAMGRLEPAEQQLQMAFSLNERVHGRDNHSTALCLAALGRLHLQRDEPAQAGALLQEALDILQGHAQPQTEAPAVMLSLAIALEMLNRREEVQPLHDQALAAARRIYGEDHAETQRVRIAIATHRLGGERAVELLREELALNRETLGPTHPRTLDTLVRLAGQLHVKKQFEESERTYLEALRLAREIYGQNHPVLVQLVMNLHWLYDQQGQNEKLGPLLREYEPVARATFGEYSRNYADYISVLGASMLRQRDESGVDLVRQSLKILTALGEDQSWRGAESRIQLALFELKRDNYDEAERLAREVIAAEPEQSANSGDSARPEMWEFRRAKAKGILGAVLTARGEFAAAQTLLLESYRTLASRKSLPAVRRAAAQRLVDLYHAWHVAQPSHGYDQQAAQWRGEIESIAAEP